MWRPPRPCGCGCRSAPPPAPPRRRGRSPRRGRSRSRRRRRPSPVPLAIARSMLSFGIEASLALRIASSSAGLPTGSPPPSRAATVMARASLENCAPAARVHDRLLVLDARPTWSALTWLQSMSRARSARSGGSRTAPAPRACGAPGHRMRDDERPRGPEIFKAYDIRGPLRRADRRRPGRADRARLRARARAGSPARPVAELRVGLGPRHAPDRARAGGPLPRRDAGARARTCSTPGRWAARCSTAWSARGSWTAG